MNGARTSEKKFLKAALWYASHGWNVFPLLEREKTPRTNHGVKDATTDEKKIRAWWRAWPDANIGVACGASGLVVVDVDARSGGLDSWAAIVAANTGIDDTIRSRTGGGGFHLFYRAPRQGAPCQGTPCQGAPGSAELRNTAGKIGPGIDTRANGGYVVLPPSIHPDGTSYVWDDDRSPAKRKCAPVPRELIEKLEARRSSIADTSRHASQSLTRGNAYAEAALHNEVEKVRSAPEGTRNATLNDAAFALGQLIGAGVLDRGAVETSLAAAALATGLAESECRSTIRSGIEAGLVHPRVLPESKSPRPSTPSRTASHITSAQHEPDEDDEPPIPLGVPQPTPMPPGIFTGWLHDMIEAEAIASETPRELSAMIALGVLAAACQKTFSVRPEPGYFEPLNLWVAPALGSGNRKTTVMITMTAPLMAWEMEQAKIVSAEIPRVESKIKSIQALASSLRATVAKKPPDFERLVDEIADLEAGMPTVPFLPRRVVQDVTPEHLGTMLANHGERLAVFSDEGGIFDLMAGRYSNGVPNLDIYLQSHAGAPVRVDRGSREPVILHHPALTIAVSPQPEVLRGLVETKCFRSRGLLARFQFLLPVSKLGFRKLEASPVSETIKDAYDGAIRSLLEMTPITCSNGEERPNFISFSEPAWKLWKDYSRVVEVEMRPDARFESMTDWAGKFPGVIAKIAGLLHCAEHAHGRPDAVEISRETMERVLKLADLLAEHALAVFDMMGADSDTVAARKILAWIEKNRLKTFTARDLGRALRSVFRKSSELEAPLLELINAGYITEQPKAPTGGRPSRVFIVTQGATDR